MLGETVSQYTESEDEVYRVRGRGILSPRTRYTGVRRTEGTGEGTRTRCTLPGYTLPYTLPHCYGGVPGAVHGGQEALPPWEGLQPCTQTRLRLVLVVRLMLLVSTPSRLVTLVIQTINQG